MLARRGRDRLRGVAVALDELEREHRAEPAHLADDRRAAPRSRRAACAAAARSARRARGSRARTSSSSTASAAAQQTGLPPNVPPRPPGCTASISSARPVTAGERQPAAERLARDDQVGLDVVVLDRPDRAGAPAARPAPRRRRRGSRARSQRSFSACDELGRHRDEAALALHRLEHEAGDLGRVDVLLEEQVEAVRARPRCVTPRYGYGAGARCTSVASGPKPCL